MFFSCNLFVSYSGQSSEPKLKHSIDKLKCLSLLRHDGLGFNNVDPIGCDFFLFRFLLAIDSLFSACVLSTLQIYISVSDNSPF